MGEEYHVSCGANLLHEITLGPGENDVGVIPKTDDAYETPLRKGVTESAKNEVEVKGTLVIYKKSFGKIFAPESWEHKFRSGVSNKPLRDEVFKLSLQNSLFDRLSFRLQNRSIVELTLTQLMYIVFTPDFPILVSAGKTGREFTLAPGDYLDIRTDTPQGIPVGQLSVSVKYCVSCPGSPRRLNYVLKME